MIQLTSFDKIIIFFFFFLVLAIGFAREKVNESSFFMKGIPIAEHVPDLTSKSDISEINKLFNL